MRRLTILAGLTICAIAQPALAQPAARSCETLDALAPLGPDAPAIDRAARDLATLYYPAMLIGAVVERNARTSFIQGIESQPGGVTILEQQPALVDVGFQASIGVVRRCMPYLLRLMHARGTEVIAARLSLSQIQATSAFYRSASGRALIASIARSMQPPTPRLRPDGTPEPFTREALRAALPSNFMDFLTPEHLAGLARFSGSTHGQAFVRAAPALEAVTVRSVNEFNALVGPEVNAAVAAAVQDYLRRNPVSPRPVSPPGNTAKPAS